MRFGGCWPILMVGCAVRAAPSAPAVAGTPAPAAASSLAAPPRSPPPGPPPFPTLESRSEPGPSFVEHGILGLCRHDVNAGLLLCQTFAPGDPSECAAVCFDQYREAHAPPRPTASVSAAPRPPLPPPDPYTLALGDCVQRVRDGECEPACRFSRPLDEMSFGQKHCDAKCAELTEGYRATHASRRAPFP